MERKSKKNLVLLLAPATIIYLIVFISPFILLLAQSFWTFQSSYVSTPGFSLENYKNVLSDPYYLGIYWRTARLSFVSTLITLILAYPLARLISRLPSGKKGFLTTLVALPMIGGAMIQTMGWMSVMMPYGAINGILLSLNIIDSKIPILGTEAGILIGLVQSFFPLMALPLITSLGAIDVTLEDAAKSLGATPMKTFFTIVLPLSIPGAISGVLLVFMANLTMYVTPSILGANKIQTFGTFVYQQAVPVGNWPFTSAYAILFLLMMGALAFVSSWLTKKIQRQIYLGE